MATRRVWARQASLWAPFVAAVVPFVLAIGGGTFAVFKYIDAKALSDKQFQTNRLISLQKPYLDRQTELYIETSKVVGKLLTLLKNTNDWKDADARFWALYYGELAMVEHCEVQTAMRSFGDQLKNAEHSGAVDTKELLGASAIRVGHALRTGMTESWTGQLVATQCPEGEMKLN